MVKNTASRAENNRKQEIIFKDKEHKKFYSSCLSKCRYQYDRMVYVEERGPDPEEKFSRNFKKKSMLFWDGSGILYSRTPGEAE